MNSKRSKLIFQPKLQIDPGSIRAAIANVAIWLLLTFVAYLLLQPGVSHAAGTLPGEDASSKLEAAGTLLRLIDTGLFQWGARIFAGICVMSAGWALKEQRYGISVICVVGAIVFGTVPKWVKNIFEVGGNQGVFSSIQVPQGNPHTGAAFQHVKRGTHALV